jgi:enoyl-CoA hydratase/carnithine racemase
MEDALVLYETDEAVSIVTLNRPSKLNAVNEALREQAVAALQRADADTSTSVVLLRANGRSFCVGYDIVDKNPLMDGHRQDALKWHEYLRECLAFEMTPWDMKKPVIASVQGHAVGGGCELAMLCDLTIAADNASFGEPEVRFSDTGPAFVMPWIIGLKKARELLYLGDTIDAQTALSLGMINRIVPDAELASASLKFAKRVSLVSPEALYWTKLAINRGRDAAGFHSAMNAGVDIISPLYAATTAFGMKFQEIKKRDGLGAALKWRGDQFKE